MNNYEKMLAHVWIELNSKINKIESGEISPEDRAKLDAIPATASALNPVALESQIPDVSDLTQRVTAAEGDIDDIQAVIPSGASASNKLATASDIPKNLNVYSVILSPFAWSSIPDASGYYDANYTILDVSNDTSFKPFAIGTTEAFNLVDKMDATNNMRGVYLTLKSKVIPSSNVEFDIYLKT